MINHVRKYFEKRLKFFMEYADSISEQTITLQKSKGEMGMKKQAVFSLEVAGILARQGFAMVEKQPNYNKPHLFVFFFERTPMLERALKTAIKQVKSNRGK